MIGRAWSPFFPTRHRQYSKNAGRFPAHWCEIKKVRGESRFIPLPNFLKYTHRWGQGNDVNAFFEAPFCRMLSGAAVTCTHAGSGPTGVQHNCQIDRKRPCCPMVSGQEDAPRACRAVGGRLCEQHGDPEPLSRCGAYGFETG